MQALILRQNSHTTAQKKRQFKTELALVATGAQICVSPSALQGQTD
jgi:hypothetical protein